MKIYKVIDDMIEAKENLNQEYVRVHYELQDVLSQYSPEDLIVFLGTDEYKKMRAKKYDEDEKICKAKKELNVKYENYVFIFNETIQSYANAKTLEEQQEHWDNIMKLNQYISGKYL